MDAMQTLVTVKMHYLPLGLGIRVVLTSNRVRTDQQQRFSAQLAAGD